jgi:WS/DGAT/MGAT family acyltransferase
VRTYLIHALELPDDPLVAACPVNVRSEGQQGKSDNRISAMFAQLHTEIGHPIPRLEATVRSSRAAKDEHALFGGDVLQQWAEIADPNLFSWLSGAYASSGVSDRHRPAINLMVSNLPGPPFALYLAGAELVRAYPMGPIMEGVGLNITVMSYRGSVDFGFMAAANLLPRVADLAAAVEPAFAELVKAVEQSASTI